MVQHIKMQPSMAGGEAQEKIFLKADSH